MASMAASASSPLRSLASPATASGSISKIGSMPTQIGEPLASMAASKRSEKISSMARMIAAAPSRREKGDDRAGENCGWFGQGRVGTNQIDLNHGSGGNVTAAQERKMEIKITLRGSDQRDVGERNRLVRGDLPAKRV